MSTDISIVIKALNEEDNISQCIESALKGLGSLSGEIILADSLSTDTTVRVAQRYPIKIVQLKHIQDRCCGVGPQLGYQYATGEYIYLLDGDMVLEENFIAQAVKIMQEHEQVGGVGGIVTELGGGNYEFEARKRRNILWGEPGEKQWLVMGALYRREAIESVGYLSNRNMHAHEEQELGLRLIDRGWKLIRLDVPAVRHHGHTIDTIALVQRRWRSRYIDGPGELLRAAFGKPFFWKALYSQRRLIVMTGIWLMLVIGLTISPWYRGVLILAATLLTLLFVVSLARKKDLKQATIGFLLWPVKIAGLIRGFSRSQQDPSEKISSRIIANE